MAVKCRILKSGYSEITQYYGGDNNHLGIDLVGKNYTVDTVLAHSDGVISYVQTNQKNNPSSTGNASYGNYIKINHGGGYFTLYAHLDKVNVKVFDKVRKGQIIGTMGNTGNSYGAHTHFEVYKNNIRVNPLEYLDKNLFESVTETVKKDEFKNQLKVNVNNLNVRLNPSTDAPIIGLAKYNGIYNYYESKLLGDYTWYKIADNEWLANKDNWCTIYLKKENLDEIEKLKDEINSLKEIIKNLKEDQHYKVFITPKNGLYYINLKKNQKLIYKSD